MSRSAYEIETALSVDDVLCAVEDFMAKRKFKLIDYKGEMVLKKGSILFPPMFIKVVPKQGTVRIEAWVRSFGEHGFSGRVGLAPKLRLKSAVEALIEAVSPLNKKDA